MAESRRRWIGDVEETEVELMEGRLRLRWWESKRLLLPHHDQHGEQRETGPKRML